MAMFDAYGVGGAGERKAGTELAGYLARLAQREAAGGSGWIKWQRSLDKDCDWDL